MSQAFPGPYEVLNTDQHVKIIGNELGLEFTIAKMVNHPFSRQGRLDTAALLASAPDLANILSLFWEALTDDGGSFNLLTADQGKLENAYNATSEILQALDYFEKETP